MRYPKEYTQKEWSKFSKKEMDAAALGNNYQFINFFTQRKESYETMSIQEKMILDYDIILTDYKTKKEKIFAVMDKFNIENLNKGITKFNKGVESFNKSIASTSKSKGPDLSGLKPKKGFGMSQREYDNLFGPKKSRKTKGNSMNFWAEDAPTRKRRNRRAKSVQKEKHMSFFGSKKVKFF